MKNRILTTLLTVTMMMSVLACWAENAPAHTKKRQINKSFKGSLAEVSVANKLGSITVIPWESSEVSFQITIEVKGDNLRRVETVFNDIDVEFSSSGVAKTVIPSTNKSNNNVNMEINYIIKMPRNLNLRINNNFGKVIIGDLESDLFVKHSFGNLEVGTLSKGANINISFGGLTIKKAKDLTLKISHGKSSVIGEVDNLQINSNFSTVKIGKALRISGNVSHDKLTIEDVGILNLTKSSFTTFNVTLLREELILKPSHSKVTVENVSQSARLIDINSSFSPIRLGIDPESNFSLDFSASFGKMIKNIPILIRDFDADGFTQHAKGFIGNESSKSGAIRVKVSHSNLTLGK